jgi:hypothetical protein
MFDQITLTGESPWLYTNRKTGHAIKVYETGDIDTRVFRVPTTFRLKDGQLFRYTRHEHGPLSAWGGNPPEDPRIALIATIINAFPTIREMKVGVNDVAIAVKSKLGWPGAQDYVVDTLFQVLAETKEPPADVPAVVKDAEAKPAPSIGHPVSSVATDADMRGIDGAVE